MSKTRKDNKMLIDFFEDVYSKKRRGENMSTKKHADIRRKKKQKQKAKFELKHQDND